MSMSSKMAWLPPALIALLCAIAPAFTTDDTMFFNYLNNVEDAQPLYYYGGYVPVLPELASFAVKGLPLAWQAVSYRIVPLLTLLLFYRQLRLLLAECGYQRDATLLALAVSIAVCAIERDLGANLAFAPWSAFLAAAIYVVRDRAHEHYSWLGAAGVLLGAVSLPLGIVIAPLLLARMMNSPNRQWQDALLAGVMVVAHGLIAAGSPDDFLRPHGASTLASMFVSGFREHKAANLIVIASTIVTIASCSLVWRRRKTIGFRCGALACIGLGSVLAYLFTDRFAHYNGFEMRYALPVFVCAVTVAALAVDRVALDARTRTLLVGIAVGAAIATTAVIGYTSLRGPLELALMKYRFLHVAQDFRSSCRGDDAMLFEDDDTSPVVLCRPQRFAPGFVAVRQVPPTIGAASARDIELPGILVPYPLF